MTLWWPCTQVRHTRFAGLLWEGLVTKFSFFPRVGSLVMQHPGESTTPTQGSVLFGTVNGAIGNYQLS